MQVLKRDVMFMTGLAQRMILLSACKGILRLTDRDSVSGWESLGSMVGGWLPRDAVESLHGQLKYCSVPARLMGLIFTCIIGTVKTFSFPFFNTLFSFYCQT